MPTSVASPPRSEPLPAANSQAEVDKGAALGQILWAGPLAAVSARTVLMILAQASVAGLYLSPWRAAAPWWSVYSTLVDIGCLALMAGFLRSEGIRLRDLIGSIRLRGGRDIFVGIGWLALALPFFTLAAQLGSKGGYGSTQPYLYPGLLAGRSLPLWAVIYILQHGVDRLVSDRGDDLPSVRVAPHPGAFRMRVGGDRSGGFRVGAAAQLYSPDSRLAIRGLALPGLPAGSDGLYVDLHAHPPAASAHRRALVVGRLCDSDHS
jgi:hypothetical protein